MKCRTCKKETTNKIYCSSNCSHLKAPSHRTNSRCRRCGEWKPLEMIRCNVCHGLVSHHPRLSAAKGEDRWLRAY